MLHNTYKKQQPKNSITSTTNMYKKKSTGMSTYSLSIHSQSLQHVAGVRQSPSKSNQTDGINVARLLLTRHVRVPFKVYCHDATLFSYVNREPTTDGQTKSILAVYNNKITIKASSFRLSPLDGAV